MLLKLFPNLKWHDCQEARYTHTHTHTHTYTSVVHILKPPGFKRRRRNNIFMQCKKKSVVVKPCMHHVWLRWPILWFEFQVKRGRPRSQDVPPLVCIYGTQQQAAAASLQPDGVGCVLMSTTAGCYWQQGCHYMLSPPTTTLLLNPLNKYNQKRKCVWEDRNSFTNRVTNMCFLRCCVLKSVWGSDPTLQCEAFILKGLWKSLS